METFHRGHLTGRAPEDFLRLGWLADIHLNFPDPLGLNRFFADLASCEAESWLVGGDIGEAGSVVPFLKRFDSALVSKTYFVLGNHDFYGGSIQDVRNRVVSCAAASDRLVYLTLSEPQALGGRVALVGEDGWGDARYGDPYGTPVMLNDFLCIRELTGLSRADLVGVLNRLGDEAAARLGPKLDRAARLCKDVVVLTHVPPFREAAWYGGRTSTDEWLPWFSCKAVGDAILDSAAAHTGAQFLVLCGHTHGSGECAPAPNIRVLTAGAAYGLPAVQRFFDF